MNLWVLCVLLRSSLIVFVVMVSKNDGSLINYIYISGARGCAFGLKQRLFNHDPVETRRWAEIKVVQNDVENGSVINYMW